MTAREPIPSDDRPKKLTPGRLTEIKKRAVQYSDDDMLALLDHIAAVEAERDALARVADEVQLVVLQSDGVAGWHLNGNVARWEEFIELARALRAVGRVK